MQPLIQLQRTGLMLPEAAI